MDSLFSSLNALAPILAQGGAPAPNPMGQLIFIGLFFAAMYFLLIAPQRKKQKQHEAMVKALEKGDKVITSGGIYGEITNVRDDRVTVQISDETKIDVVRNYIQSKRED
jgi:preprotein translocase subunit YajC